MLPADGSIQAIAVTAPTSLTRVGRPGDILESITSIMKITTKGQVTIPQRFRVKFGLLPHTDVAFEEADGGVVVRPVLSKRALIEQRLREVRGVAGGGMSTDEVMRLTRGDE